MDHEHQRTDRDTYVSYIGTEPDKDSIRRKNTIDVGSPYDLCSLTHYGESFFVKKLPQNPGCTPGQFDAKNAQPSALDIQKVNSKYQCGKPYHNLETCSDYYWWVVCR